MKVKDIIAILNMHPEKDIVVFAEGRIYPVLGASVYDNELEIECGWVRKEEE